MQWLMFIRLWEEDGNNVVDGIEAGRFNMA